MDEFKSNVPRTFVQRINRKTVYLTLLTAFAAAAIVGLLLAPTFNGTVTVSAQQVDTGGLDREMLAAALNFKSASNYTIYAERGSRLGPVRGEVFDGRAEAIGSAAKSDMAASMNYINQLPCNEIEGSDLGGRSFGPGIYCVSSARLAGEMVLDAGGDQSAMFLFKVKGDFNADAGSRITLSGGALASNAYFVAERTTVGTDAAFNGSIISRGDVAIGGGSIVKGRVISVSGSVSARNAEVHGGPGQGVLQICKSVPVGSGLENRIFGFTVSGSAFAATPLTVPANQCSAPFDVNVGTQTITELNTGTFTNQTGTFTGGFLLQSVVATTNLGTSTLGAVNAPLRTASVTIAEGGPAQMLSLRVTNIPATTGVVEICKAAVDVDVTGVFRFTVQGVFAQPGGTALQVFQAPVGGCVGPITVAIPTTTPNHATIPVLISELGPAAAAAAGPGAPTGFELIAIASDPAGRLCVGPVPPFAAGSSLLLNGRLNADGSVTAGANPGGGVGCFTVVGTSPLDPGDASEETRAIFTNRSAPGIVKVCKIAGPGINLNTVFRFEVRGTSDTGAAITRLVDVLAGPAAQGGNCQLVPVEGVTPGAVQRFRIGTPVLVRELGISPLNTIPFDPDILVSRIRVFNTAFVAAPVTVGGITTNPNPDITPNDGDLGRAVANARREEVVFEFTDIVFHPTVLKICKIAGNGIAAGSPFSFTVTRDTAGGLLPAFSTTVTVQAGPAGQGGFCQLVPGPGASAVGPGFGVGQLLTIQEATVAGTAVTAIISPSGSNLTTNLAGRSTLITLGGPNADGTNVVTFTNSVATLAEAVRFDFDGDKKSDASIFTPSSGRWTYASSSAGGAERGYNFGVSTDKLVSADYDGDGIYDEAVFRPSDGKWYIHGSTGIYRVQEWGQAGDIPQAGDFDGDGRADLTVFRPSNGLWYTMMSRDGIAVFQFGVSTDKPIAADYDGDGKTDAAVFRSGRWFIAGSRYGFVVYDFGIATDRAVPADYDGDKKADIAVYRSGTWFVLGSLGTYRVYEHGLASDTPVPADFDGDGKTDLAVFRPTEGKWYIRRSSQTDAGGEMSTISLGSSTDMAIPAQ